MKANLRTHTIQYGSGTTVNIRAVPRSRLSDLNRLLLEIQAIWAEHDYSVGDAIADPQCWETLQKVAAMIPDADSGNIGFDLDKLESDYPQLQELFFAQQFGFAQKTGVTDKGQPIDYRAFDPLQFRPCVLHALHAVRMDGPKKQMQIQNLQEELFGPHDEKSSEENPSPQTTFPSEQAA